MYSFVNIGSKNLKKNWMRKQTLKSKFMPLFWDRIFNPIPYGLFYTLRYGGGLFDPP